MKYSDLFKVPPESAVRLSEIDPAFKDEHDAISASAAARLRLSDHYPTILPRQATPLIGREDVLAEIEALVRDAHRYG